jgi:putative glutamine amidotransferase
MKRQRSHKSPLIGITPDSSTAAPNSSRARPEPVIFLLERYLRAVLEAGGIPLVLPLMPSKRAIAEILAPLDGILVTGGNFDIHPGIYGEEPLEALGQIKENRTEFELELIALALKRKLPILGVCGGAQAINIALGGSLYQDIATQRSGAMEHEQGALKERGGHIVTVHAGTKLQRIVGRERIEVNTTHHQAVRKLGRSLVVNATAADGVIEGIESKDHSFVLGVQWHPEFLTQRDISQKKIFASFISACRAAKR